MASNRFKSTRFRLAAWPCLVAVPTTYALAGCDSKDAPTKRTGTGARILVDSIHAHNYIEHGLQENIYDYHRTGGYRLGFSFLKAQGIDHDVVTTGELDAAVLAGRDLLFINLVSAELPPFTVPEIHAIVQFVQGGGGVLFITDHSNCYFHAHKLKPLFGELGLSIANETACEAGPGQLSEGSGWIDINRFDPHPVTAGLRHIAFQSGGTVDDRFGVARTSDKAWGDLWQVHPYMEGDTPGFYGNWKQDAGERSGPLAVVAAKELGKGRIVVVGDQNIFGDPFIGYGDNHRLFLNTVNWLLKGNAAQAEQLADAFAAWRTPRILCYENFAQAAFGTLRSTDFYHFFVHLNRKHGAFANDDLSGEHQLVIVADDVPMPAAQLEHLLRHLKAGRNLLILRAAGFAFIGEDSLTGQLAAKLGQPQTSNTGIAQVAQFNGAGKVYVVLHPDPLTAGQFADPNKSPDAAQETMLRRVDAMIQKLLPGK